MKGKIGLIFVVLCVISYFIYNSGGKNKTGSDVERIIQGKVVDIESGAPIEGATVAFQGENYKSRTDAHGEYAIFAKESSELVFRHNNYTTEVVVGKNAKLVKLKPSGPPATETSGEN